MIKKKFRLLLASMVFFFIVFPLTIGLWISFDEWSGQSDRRYRCKGSSYQSLVGVDQSVVQVYSARSARWRGVVSVHSWIVIKKKDMAQYVRYEVIGWGHQSRRSYIRKTSGNPDNYWYGYRPDKIFELTGEKADLVIKKIESEIENYPYAMVYRAWPGPNSNTFVAYISRNIPEMQIDLPPTAIGKDYISGMTIAEPPSNTGIQLSYEGVLGLIISREEGVELNLAGAVYGIDLKPLAVKIFALGRINLNPANSPITNSAQCQ